MTTIEIYLNNGKVLYIQCGVEHSVDDIHTLARQISDCLLVDTTSIGFISYKGGKECTGY